MKALGFAVACKKYFGFLPGQPLAGFIAEVHKLTEEDRKEMSYLLSKELGTPVSSELKTKQ